MPHPRLIGVVVLAIALDGYACDPSTPAPSPSPTAPAAPAPAPTLTVTKVVVTGNTSLTAIGETSQMTATATLSDGTTKNVTSDASWSSTNQSVLTVVSYWRRDVRRLRCGLRPSRLQWTQQLVSSSDRYASRHVHRLGARQGARQ